MKLSEIKERKVVTFHDCYRLLREQIGEPQYLESRTTVSPSYLAKTTRKKSLVHHNLSDNPLESSAPCLLSVKYRVSRATSDQATRDIFEAKI